MVSGCDQKRYPYLCSNKENKMDFEQKLIVVTSRHDCYDNRIYEKQIKSFLKAGYVITYVFPICSGPIPTLFNLTPKKLKSGSIIKKHIEIFNIIRRERIDKLLIKLSMVSPIFYNYLKNKYRMYCSLFKQNC